MEGVHPQWDHRPNWKVHRLKYHSTLQEQRRAKYYLEEDDEERIPNCFRCSEGFWTKSDLEAHLKVWRMLHATEEQLSAPQWLFRPCH